MRKRAIAIGLALSLITSMSPASAVVSGSEVIDAATSKPWVASIWYAEDEYSISEPQFICSGSLIDADIVLTAAHCVFDTGFYFVRLQSDTLESNSPLLRVSSTWRNPRYSSKKFVNDVGLLKLEKPTTVTPMVYATAGDTKALSKTKSFEILGWGDNQDGDVATYLRRAKLAIQTTSATKLYGTKNFNSKTMIAAGTYIKNEKIYTGGCSGDSGGPLVATLNGVQKVVGITSWGSVNCNLKLPTIFTNVPYYAKDISTGLAFVRRSSEVFNRTPVENLSPPTITGSYVNGGTMTCNPGTWSSNATSYSVRWTSPYDIYGSQSQNVTIRSASLYGTVFTCSVTAKSPFSTKTITVTSTFYSPPVASSTPLIFSIYNGIQTAVGTQGRCNSYFYGTITNTSYEWFLSSSSTFVAGNAQSVATGQNITITEDIKTKALSGQNYLHCVATASNSGGSTNSSSSVALTFAPPSNPER